MTTIPCRHKVIDSSKYVRWSGKQRVDGLEIFSRVFHDEEIVFLQSAVFEVLVTARLPADAAKLVQLELHVDGAPAREAPATSPKFGSPVSAVGAALSETGAADGIMGGGGGGGSGARKRFVGAAATTPKQQRRGARTRSQKSSLQQKSTSSRRRARGNTSTTKKSQRLREDDDDDMVTISRKFVVPAARGQSIGAKVVPVQVCIAKMNMHCVCVLA